MIGYKNVALRLREMILRGELEPGQRLAEVALAERLGVSRTPIRQALPALAREGLLAAAGRRGYVVRSFSAQDVEWEVVGYEGDDFGRVWRMNGDLDLDDVADELVDSGFEEESGEGRTLSIDVQDIAAEEQYLIAMQNVTLLPDEHLIVTGPLADDVLDVIDDDADSAVDTDAFEDLVDGTDEVSHGVSPVGWWGQAWADWRGAGTVGVSCCSSTGAVVRPAGCSASRGGRWRATRPL